MHFDYDFVYPLKTPVHPTKNIPPEYTTTCKSQFFISSAQKLSSHLHIIQGIPNSIVSLHPDGTENQKKPTFLHLSYKSKP